MKEERARESLKEAISDVMETMFFLPVQFADKTCPLGPWFSGEGEMLESSVDFKCPGSGRIFLFAPRAGVEEMSANILGIEADEVSEGQVSDTLKEAINMMTGRMLSLVDQEGSFALGIPRFAGAWNGKSAPEEADFSGLLLFDTGKNHLAAGFVLS